MTDIKTVTRNLNFDTTLRDSSNLPSDKDSIYFLADKSGDSFNIRWRGEAASFMKRVD